MFSPYSDSIHLLKMHFKEPKIESAYRLHNNRKYRKYAITFLCFIIACILLNILFYWMTEVTVRFLLYSSVICFQLGPIVACLLALTRFK